MSLVERVVSIRAERVVDSHVQRDCQLLKSLPKSGVKFPMGSMMRFPCTLPNGGKRITGMIGECERQVNGLFESLLAQSFGE